MAGRKQVAELLRFRSNAVRALLLLQNTQLSEDLRGLIEAARTRGVRVTTLEREAFEKTVGVPVHQGVAASITPREPLDFKEFLETLPKDDAGSIVVVLDQVTDPHNLGAILRVAEGMGVSGVVMTSDHSAPLSPATRRTSLGASEFVPLAQVTNLHRALTQLKDHGFWIVGTALGENSADLPQVDVPRPVAVVFGSEGEGIRELTRATCDLVVKIPMRGKLESLNVSQAAAIVLYELTRSGKEKDSVKRGS